MISNSDQLLFCKNMATLLRAGIPIIEAVETIEDQSQSLGFKKILGKIKKDLIEGESLSRAMEKQKNAFNKFFINMIDAGEKSGNLENNLKYLSEQIEKIYQTSKKIQSALMYPVLLISVALLIGGYIAYAILPKFVDFFAAFDTKLPLTTSILLGMANFMKYSGGKLAIGIIATIVIFGLLGQIPAIKLWWDKIKMKLPIIGKIICFGQLNKFTRNMGVLLNSGISINQGLEISANTLNNRKFKKDIKAIYEEIMSGEKLSEAMGKRGREEFSKMTIKMIAVGEKSGNLGEMMIYVADFYEEEIENITKNLGTMLEPVLLVFIGFCVAFLASAIISPIYQLTGSIGK